MKHFDIGSILIIVATFVLFIAPFFFLPALPTTSCSRQRVFLVSAKLIVMAYKSSISAEKIEREQVEI